MRRVAQHDAAQVARCLRGVDRAAKALLIQQRQVAGVIHVRVRDEHELDLCRRDGDGDILEQIAPLLHAAVYQAVVPADLEQGAAAGHLVVGADKCQLHGLAPSGFLSLILTQAHAERNRGAKSSQITLLPRRDIRPAGVKSMGHSLPSCSSASRYCTVTLSLQPHQQSIASDACPLVSPSSTVR